MLSVTMAGVGQHIVSGAEATKIVVRVTNGQPITEALHRTFDALKTAGVIVITLT